MFPSKTHSYHDDYCNHPISNYGEWKINEYTYLYNVAFISSTYCKILENGKTVYV